VFEAAAVTAIVVLLLASLALTAARRRRLESDERRDRSLFAELSEELVAGRLPEARDRVRAAEGPLARVLLAVLRFPYGVHEQALEMARRDGLVAERPAFRGTGLLLPILSGLCAVVGIACLALPGRPTLPPVAVPLLALTGACAILGLWASDARRSRDGAHRLQIASWEVSRRLVAISEPGGARRRADRSDLEPPVSSLPTDAETSVPS
jgi:hypothetical protein